MHLSKSDLQSFDRIKRLNIINSISGIKPANLIGTISNTGISNLAIFSSVVHLGSNPALIGMITRPEGKIRRHTFDNLKESGYYTINHIHDGIIDHAHYTSAKFEDGVSEFKKCNLEEEYLDGFKAPYVKISKLKIGLQFKESIPIKANNTEFIIGEVNHIYVDENAMDENGYINFEMLNEVGISGLNSYYSLKKVKDLPYARPNELPEF